MTGWLPKEILDHLEHAGYVAVPKEQVEVIWARERVSDMELARLYIMHHEHDFQIAQRQRMARQMAMHLLEQGFIDVQVEAPGKDGTTEHRASLHVLKPRTLRAEVK